MLTNALQRITNVVIVKSKDTLKLNAEAKGKPRVPERARRIITKVRKNLVHME